MQRPACLGQWRRGKKWSLKGAQTIGGEKCRSCEMKMISKKRVLIGAKLKPRSGKKRWERGRRLETASMSLRSQRGLTGVETRGETLARKRFWGQKERRLQHRC